MTGNVEERESCEPVGVGGGDLRVSSRQHPRKQREFVKRSRNCFLTLGVKTQKRRAFTKP